MKRDTIVLVIALACGLAAFSLIMNVLKQASQPKGQFVMAKIAIAKGKIISSEDVGISPLVKNVPEADYFMQLHEVIGKESQLDIPAGQLIQRVVVKDAPPPSPEPVKETKKVEEEKDAVLPVPALMRALTLGVQELENLPAVLKSGDYVDVLGYVGIDNNQKEVRTLLRGAQVLSVQKSEQKQIQSVTLALYPEQVETLLNISRAGKIRLIVSQKPAANAQGGFPMSSIEVIRGIQREKKSP